MADPAVEAGNRVFKQFSELANPTQYTVTAAREALKPIRELCDGMREMFGDDFEIHIDDLAELIYTTEELAR